MKIVTLLFAALCGVSSLTAQPVLMESDMAAAGFSMQMYLVTSAGTSNPAPNGAGITWDFTSAQMQLIGTAFMGDPNNTPFASQFPTANWSITQDLFGIEQYYSYFRSMTNGLELIADNVPDDANVYVNPKQILQFPFNFMGTFNDTYQKEGEAPATVIWEYSAYGTILSDLGIDNDVVKTVSNEGDIVFWKKTPLHPFIIMNPEAIIVFSNNPIGIDALGQLRKPSLYPNPANDLIHISNTLPGDLYSVIDATGRILMEGAFLTGGIAQLSIAQLTSGMYRLRIINGRDLMVLPLIKQ